MATRQAHTALCLIFVLFCAACAGGRGQEPAPLSQADIRFVEFAVEVDPAVGTDLDESEPKRSEYLASALKNALEAELSSPEFAGENEVRVEAKVTDLQMEEYPLRLSGEVSVIDLQDSSNLSVYRVTARYGEKGVFKNVAQSIVTTMLQTDTVRRLSEIFAAEVKNAVAPSTVP